MILSKEAKTSLNVSSASDWRIVCCSWTTWVNSFQTAVPLWLAGNLELPTYTGVSHTGGSCTSSPKKTITGIPPQSFSFCIPHRQWYSIHPRRLHPIKDRSSTRSTNVPAIPFCKLTPVAPERTATEDGVQQHPTMILISSGATVVVSRLLCFRMNHYHLYRIKYF